MTMKRKLINSLYITIFIVFSIAADILGQTQVNPMYCPTVLGDKISLWGNRLGDADMYGFGIEPSTIYFKSQQNYRWYINRNADGGNNNVMELTNSGLSLNGPYKSIGSSNGNHSFIGTYKEATFTNWLGTGLTADAYNLLGYSNPHAGFGVVNGSHIVSPIVWMYGYSDRNAFLVKTMDYNGDMTSGVNQFMVKANGNTHAKKLRVLPNILDDNFHTGRLAAFHGADTGGNGWIEVWGNDGKQAGILFGNPTDEWQGRIHWDDNVKEMAFYSEKIKVMTVNKEGRLDLESSSNPTLRVKHKNEGNTWGLQFTQKDDLTGYIAMPGRDLQIVSGWNQKIILGTSEYDTHTGGVVIPWGKVGIGTKTPTEKLHVNGDVRIHATSNGRDFYLRPGSGSLDMYNANLSLNRYSNMNISMVLGGGNVGIGTSTPKNKLSVNGTIWAKKVKVTLEDAADWVFEEDYELRSLEEVEEHITKYKHLPDMPSAEEFRENDLDVAEMDNRLLQKIEELTLYLIEQNKDIQLLKKENQELKKLINSKE